MRKIDYNDIERRFESCISLMSDSSKKTIRVDVSAGEKLTEKLGTGLVMPTEVRVAAFLLGFEDSRDYLRRGKLPILESSLRNIIFRSLSKARVDGAYLESCVEKVFEKLGDEGRLNYTRDRFYYALGRVVDLGFKF